MQGDCEILDTEEPIFAFIREAPQQRLLCIFNLSPDTAHFDLHDDWLPCVTASGANPAAKRNDGMLRLRGYGYFFGNLESATRPAKSGTATDWKDEGNASTDSKSQLGHHNGASLGEDTQLRSLAQEAADAPSANNGDKAAEGDRDAQDSQVAVN